MARASLIIFRFKTNVSLKLLPEWMLSVRPNPVWVKQPFLFWQHCNNWIKKRQTTQVALKCLSCATLVNLLFKSQKNIKDFQNTWKISRYVLSLVSLPLGSRRWNWKFRESIFEIRIPNFCYIQVIVFGLSCEKFKKCFSHFFMVADLLSPNRCNS